MDVSESSLLLYSLVFEAFYYCSLLQQALQKAGAEILSFSLYWKVTFVLSSLHRECMALSDYSLLARNLVTPTQIGTHSLLPLSRAVREYKSSIRT